LCTNFGPLPSLSIPNNHVFFGLNSTRPSPPKFLAFFVKAQSVLLKTEVRPYLIG
jgi:hypothetical protein